MDSKDSIWSRRNNVGNLSLSTPGQHDNSSAPRDYSSLSRRSGPGSSHGGRGPIPFGGTQTPANTLASPGGAGNAFGLGSGAFGFAGASSAKTPKTPGNPYEREWGALGGGSKTPSTEKTAKDAFSRAATGKPSMGSISEITGKPQSSATSHPLRNGWTFWFRPPISKANGYIEYERSLHPIAHVTTAEEFWAVYNHLKHPSDLPEKSDYHLFKQGIRPIWEDDVNKQGGKLVVRLKKGAANRFWDETLLACIGDQFGEDNEEICGVVLSVRNNEDILSIWLRHSSPATPRIKETVKRCVSSIYPGDLNFVWKSHDASQQQAANTPHHDNNANKRPHHNKNQRQTQDEPRA
ncbi:translation initiation factor eIF 4e-like domain-containing protein [Microdochium trichocladiopsis]|uniref:Translation initiation factor eIF 4e-like domain-containing protein n=1 Tax=Microdochium trichocladiopsis TaxID=1682393 RepID=A0A9P9BS66_9PEZI|nr:translation initiation factor eIF 4e-like domain-containing protein [Microdochium trichocladiopsis]KAH7033433.1 translation initiation factor eIF 4e-like domain-containing protein [Microdochium trichocladiopsis]